MISESNQVRHYYNAGIVVFLLFIFFAKSSLNILEWIVFLINMQTEQADYINHQILILQKIIMVQQFQSYSILNPAARCIMLGVIFNQQIFVSTLYNMGQMLQMHRHWRHLFGAILARKSPFSMSDVRRIVWKQHGFISLWNYIFIIL